MQGILQNQVALVTGGTAGIGKAIAESFASQGANVVIFGTHPERGQQAVQEIQEKVPGSSIHFFAVNISDSTGVEEAVQLVLKTFGRVDILVNNAGITRDQLLLKMTEKDWDDVMDVNVKGLYLMCKALARPMLKAKKGKIINISSVIGLTGNSGQVNYSASKAAIMGFTKALAKELASRHICVNCIAPGFIQTQMTDALLPEQKEAILKTIPLGRMGLPFEIANMALFLASEMSSYITGQVFVVDGGMVMA